MALIGRRNAYDSTYPPIRAISDPALRGPVEKKLIDFQTEKFMELPPAAPRQTGEIGVNAPCGACPIRHAAVHTRIKGKDLERLLEVGSRIDLRRGQTLFIEGEAASLLFTITNGVMMAYKMTADGRRQINGFLFHGDMLGLVNDGCYACSAAAITDCSLFSYPISKIQRLVRTYPRMEERLCKITRQELVEAQEKMLLLGRASAQERLACFLLKLARHSSDRGRPREEISIPMTGEMIADYTGLAQETVSRTLTKFKRSGIISDTHGEHVKLERFDRLEAIAKGLVGSESPFIIR